MYKVYRGDPKNGGKLIGIYHHVKTAARAMEEDAACHPLGTSYHMIREGDDRNEDKTDQAD